MLLKAKIEKDGHKFVKTNKDAVKYWFNVINREIFKDKLPQFNNIRIVHLKNNHAQVVTDDYDFDWVNDPIDLEINIHFRTFRLFINVLAHEMVHLWQEIGEVAQDDIGKAHDGYFWSWKDKFAEQGLELDDSY